MDDIKLPGNFVVSPSNGAARYLVLARESAQLGTCWVTLDLEQRVFWFGKGISGPPTQSNAKGRGWKQQLVDEAVLSLETMCAANENRVLKRGLKR